MIKKVVSIFKNRAFLVTLLIALFLTSALIIAAMWLGQESGNFVIRIQDETNTRTIALTEADDPEDEEQYVTRLTTTGIGNFHDNTMKFFMHKGSEVSDLKELTSVMGVNHTLMETSTSEGSSSQESSLYCYTFYIVNTSSSAFTVNIEMTYSGISNNLDDAIRVLTYNENNEKINVYQKEDTSGTVDYVTDAEYYITPTNFVSDSIAYQETASLGQGSETDVNPKYVKYSVLFWLEGEDPDCKDSILGGAIKFELNISVQS